MNGKITRSNIKEIVSNPLVLHHLFKLHEEYKRSVANDIENYSEELIVAIQESPNTTSWIKNTVIPNLYEGDEGLDEILNGIEKEENMILSATKMQIVLDILGNLSGSLNDLKESVESGDNNVEENMKNFDKDIPFKVFH